MTIVITNNSGTISVAISAAYTLNGVTISPQTYYFNKSDVNISSSGENVNFIDGNKSFSFLYSDITTPSGGSASAIAAIIQAYIP